MEKCEFTFLFTTNSVDFAPTVADILKGINPPTIGQLKSLPDQFSRDDCGVYVLVLEKPNSKQAIYVGSSTNSEGN